tara:strand:- start:1263 stop:1439 length:177 start_codon:yes stop_codon:yes gene_type:complete
MRELEIVEGIAKAHLASKKARLNARVDEIAREKGMSIVERAKFRARAIDAVDRGELVL